MAQRSFRQLRFQMPQRGFKQWLNWLCKGFWLRPIGEGVNCSTGGQPNPLQQRYYNIAISPCYKSGSSVVEYAPLHIIPASKYLILIPIELLLLSNYAAVCFPHLGEIFACLRWSTYLMIIFDIIIKSVQMLCITQQGELRDGLKKSLFWQRH